MAQTQGKDDLSVELFDRFSIYDLTTSGLGYVVYRQRGGSCAPKVAIASRPSKRQAIDLMRQLHRREDDLTWAWKMDGMATHQAVAVEGA